MNELDDDARLIEVVAGLADGPITMLRVGKRAIEIQESRGRACFTALVALLMASRANPEEFNLLNELGEAVKHFPPLRNVRRAAAARILLGAIAGSGLTVFLLRRGAMVEWAVKIVEITGVPGLALLVLWYFFTPIANRVGLGTLSSKATERLILVAAVGLLMIAFVALALYSAPNIIRAVREVPTTAPGR